MAISTEQSQDYTAKFEGLIQSLGTGQDLTDFLTNPKPALEKAGIPLVEAADIPDSSSLAATSDAPTKDVETKWKWYGMDIIMSESGTQLIAGTTGGVGTITAALAATLPIPGANVLAAGLTIAFAAKIGEIEVVDYKHRGVHWVITWAQWAAILLTIPLGPAAVTASVAVFIHPSPN